MTMGIKQLRIARPTDQMNKIIEFYKDGLGLQALSSFKDHDGFSGIMLGDPGKSYHLEFTEHIEKIPCSPPSKDNLLVFYFDDKKQRDQTAEKLFNLGYLEVEPSNPYWKINGISIADPDGWRIVLTVL